MSDALLISVDDGVAVLTFNRPDAANTWSADLHVAYLEALADLAVDHDVRAAVITGAGRHFCAGADMSLLDHIQGGGGIPEGLDSASFLKPMTFPKPLIAAVNGSAAGIGFVHALMCDVRFAADSAVFTTAFSQRGLVAEHGVSWLLPQIVGRGHALDLLLSARRVSGTEAERIGLVHRSCPVDQVVPTAIEYARTLARTCSPAAMRAVKHQVTGHASVTLEEAEGETIHLVADSIRGADFTEGVQSFLERRPARFEPLGRGTTFPSLGDAGIQPARVAEAFFHATSSGDWDAAIERLSPDARLVTHPGPPATGVDGLAASWQKLRDTFGAWEYLDIRRTTTDRGFCEQHRVRFCELDVELEVCVVATLDDAGRIVHLEEYADGAALRDARRRQDPLASTP